MIVIVCPGQGSQTPGFLDPWLSIQRFSTHLDTMASVLGSDLRHYGSTADADTIRDTAIAQPLIVAAGLLAMKPLVEQYGTHIRGIAGHSVGEITAAVGAGILSESDALHFVGARGTAMAEAARLTPTGMSAVLGGNEPDVLAQVSSLGLEPANFNGAGQIVVAGALEPLAQLRETPPSGARVIPLRVAGAFHTSYMDSATPRLSEAARGVTPHDPSRAIWTNNNGTLVDTGERFVDLLVGQISSPVRWDACMSSIAAAGVRGIIELPPAGTLSGLFKRVLPDVPCVALKAPEDLDRAAELFT